MIPPNKILLIEERPRHNYHYVVHYDKRVEFWSLQGKKVGENKVEVVKEYT